jgi:hypothetical protein
MNIQDFYIDLEKKTQNMGSPSSHFTPLFRLIFSNLRTSLFCYLQVRLEKTISARRSKGNLQPKSTLREREREKRIVTLLSDKPTIHPPIVQLGFC